MVIFVTGTRGIPDIPGGVERHCQMLYPLIAGSARVVLSVRSCYAHPDHPRWWNGVQLVTRHAPRRKSFEAIAHTCLAILKAGRHRPDLIHIHAIGPALLTPLARLLGHRVVVTHHGPDYRRAKWGWLARQALRAGEYLGGVFAGATIVISEEIAEIVRHRCHVDSVLIPNGVVIPRRSEGTDALARLGLEPGRYVLNVSRFVPEKGLHDLIEAFAKTGARHRLVIAGDADHETPYSRNIKKMAAARGVVLTGYITGEPLRQLYSHARLFVLPSYHEGLPIALLEAMSYGRDVLVSDIRPNREVSLPESCYFKTGDVADLAERMRNKLGSDGTVEAEGVNPWADMLRKYDWERIAERTIQVYRKVIDG